MRRAVLVTGGMGFIGPHTARRLLEEGCPVVLTQHRPRRLPAFVEAALGRGLDVARVDLLERERLVEVMRACSIGSVVHLAAPALGTAPAEEFRAAIGALANVLEAGLEVGVGRVTVASSVAVYSNVAARPWREELPLPVESDSHTAAVKKATEVMALHFADRTGLDVRVLRLAAVYGPLYHSMANLPSRLCHAAAFGLAPDLEGVRGGPPYAEAATDLCFVADCAAGIAAVHLAGRLQHRVYNVGGGRAVRNQALADAVARAVPGFQVSLPRAATPAMGDDAWMDLGRINQDVAYAPAYGIERGVADYIAWLRTEAAIGCADAVHRSNPLDTPTLGS